MHGRAFNWWPAFWHFLSCFPKFGLLWFMMPNNVFLSQFYGYQLEPWLYVLVMSHIRFRVNPHYSCLNVKELLGRSRCEIWRWSDCNWTRTQNHLVLKRTLNHLAKLTSWLSCVLSTYLYGAFDCVLVMLRTDFRVNPHSIVAWAC